MLDKFLTYLQERDKLKVASQEKNEKPDFEFDELWQDDQNANFWKFVPVINGVLLLIILVIMSLKK